ncbi:MAG: histidine phosphatase family protein [Propionibacteriaceae bacterium]|nr:histidine phosphatase family protein [Propionibacteriaceae bacterium]
MEARLSGVRLILIRHGRTTSNQDFRLDTAQPGADLDELGKQQARQLVDKMAAYPIEAIFASTLVRTQQTAAPLANSLNLTITVLPGLREVSAGVEEMSSDATNYVKMMQSWKAGDLTQQIPGGENAIDFLTRFDLAVAQIATSGVKTAALFSHGAALRAWSWVRIAGFTEEIGDGLVKNTGFIVADGDQELGWKLHRLEGVHIPAAYLPNRK